MDLIQTHLTSSIRGSILQTGITTVLLGAPNVGKSSLLNILAQKDASIVSPEPGTTRDVVRVLLDIAGFPCVVGDTAGLRDGDCVGAVEKEGVLRAKQQADSSDLRLLVVDVTLGVERSLQEVTPYLQADAKNIPTILILNKIDMVNSSADDLKTHYSIATELSTDFIFPVSCLTMNGFDDFSCGMTKILQDMTGSAENVLVTNERQRKLLHESMDHLRTFLSSTHFTIIA